ncbi:MAG: tRNA 4-thiouridine(8) synthase ThiI [Lentisphaeria bacterium]|nr:tRNA 4-thiouridine(8) synthase ThiI [Lentisphaeria bacterium]
MYNCIICRYHEIATKGNNRSMFERCLVDNIRHLLKTLEGIKVSRVRGRVRVERDDKGAFTAEQLDVIKVQLSKCFGLESFSPAVITAVDMEQIRPIAVELASAAINANQSEGKPSFRVRARRSNKRFPLTSKDIEIDLVSAVAARTGEEKFSIDLNNAQITLGCEVRDEFAVLFMESLPAPGGLPVGCNPRVMTLLSGGIDSPVAAWLIMKRGSPCDYITFHSAPYTPPETVEKVQRVAAKLNEYQLRGTLCIANLSEFQKAVRDNCKEKFRTVLYRRAMMRIAEIVARHRRCHALVTGDSLGQVASQTVPNMYSVGKAVDMLVLRPLVGSDKLECIRLAEEIGTFDISNVQVPDSCTVFAPSSPCTSSEPEILEQEEAKIADYWQILEKIARNVEEWT